MLIDKIKQKLKTHLLFYHILFGALTAFRGIVGVFMQKKGTRDFLLSSFSFLRRLDYVKGLPINITIEPSNMCNLKCPICETGAGILGREKKNMSFDEFKRIIDKVAPFVNTLMLYFMGEPFLNSDFYRMIEYAKRKDIPFVTVCTNGEYVDAESLVRSGIDEISFQISGLTPETHRVYRIGGDLKRVMDNLKAVVIAKKKYNARLKVVCGFIVMKHNEHELKILKKYMADIDIDAISIIKPCARNMEQAKNFLPKDERLWLYDNNHYESSKSLKPKNPSVNACPWIYYSLVILANGDIVPCCRDTQGQHIMGNVLREDFADIWNNAKFRDFRKSLRDVKSKPSICNLCSGFGLAILR